MSKCEGQKAECYQAGICHYCKPVEIIECGMLVEMFDEPSNWGTNVIVWLIYFGLSLFLIWIGFIAAKFF